MLVILKNDFEMAMRTCKEMIKEYKELLVLLQVDDLEKRINYF